MNRKETTKFLSDLLVSNRLCGMTENEAIEVLKKPCLYDYSLSHTIESCDISSCDKRDATIMAVKALEEIQQYRALGTVEELREAMEKQRAKKILKRKCDGCDKDCVGCDDYANRCPTCKESVDNDLMIEYAYCPNCGQAIDWREEE